MIIYVCVLLALWFWFWSFHIWPKVRPSTFQALWSKHVSTVNRWHHSEVPAFPCDFCHPSVLLRFVDHGWGFQHPRSGWDVGVLPERRTTPEGGVGRTAWVPVAQGRGWKSSCPRNIMARQAMHELEWKGSHPQIPGSHSRVENHNVAALPLSWADFPAFQPCHQLNSSAKCSTLAASFWTRWNPLRGKVCVFTPAIARKITPWLLQENMNPDWDPTHGILAKPMINRSKCLARKLSGAILPIFIPEGLEAQNPAVVLQVLLQLLIPTAASNSDLIVFLARGSALLFLCFHREPN